MTTTVIEIGENQYALNVAANPTTVIELAEPEITAEIAQNPVTTIEVCVGAGTPGPVGPVGPQGDAATIQVGTTQTGAPGTDAEVTNSGTQQAAIFNFVIPRGEPGSGGNTFIFNQPSPATTWNILHNLGQFPSVTVVDSGGTVIIGDVLYNNSNSITLSFVAALGGKAYLN